MSEVLVIQNSRFEGLAGLEKLLQEDGFKTRIVLAKHESIPSIKPRFVIILGAPESANDDLPYLKEELNLIRDSVEKEIPVLGICLGSQLIAKAFGAKVYQGKKKEIGFYQDIEFDNESKSKLFNGIKSPALVFHWHGDTFDLPKDAIRLAHSKDYQNQAIKIGSAVGVQFHLEVDENTIRLWLEKSKEELSSLPYINPREITMKIPQNIDAIWNNLRIFYQNFKSEFNLTKV
ncbi:MAG TPA: type 1 glutamine amidotransferase [Candidatus Bathyarchaeia archaeon]|nr:type 1 glutamine amidotransferase [Candidatus Bathyarchaeia archaeon]